MAAEHRSGGQRQDSQQIPKAVFELIDKELRKIDLKEVEVMKEEDEMRRDAYPVSTNLMRLIRKFQLPDRFYYDGGKFTHHFTLIINEEGAKITVVSFK